MAILNAIDLTVIVAYFVIVVAFGFWVGRGERDATDYFLAGRMLPWYLIGLSYFASNMSGASFVGLMGAAYQYGLAVYNYEWTASVVLAFFAILMLPALLRARLFTMPGYLTRRFDRRTGLGFAGLTILTLMFIDIPGALYAGGVVISTAFPGVDLWATTAALAVVAGAYTLFGGLKAVVVTDAMQAVLVIVGAGLITYFGLEAVGGWTTLTHSLGEAEMTLFRAAADPFLPWPGIFGIILLGFYYWSINQYFVQRALAARSRADGQRGALFAGLLKLPNLFLMVVPGMIAIQLLPALDNPDQVFAKLAFELLPVGLRGLIVTALLAAIMSSLDSALNAAASLLTMDFVRPMRPALSGERLLLIGRLFTAVLIVVAALYAPVIERFGSLFVYFQSTLAYIVPPIVAIYFGGLFMRRTNAAGAFWAIVAGLGVGVPLYLAKEVTGLWSDLGFPFVHFTYVSIGLFAFSVIVMVLVSLTGPRPDEQRTAPLMFAREDLSGPDGIGLGDIRVQAALLVVAVFALLALFA